MQLYGNINVNDATDRSACFLSLCFDFNHFEQLNIDSELQKEILTAQIVRQIL